MTQCKYVFHPILTVYIAIFKWPYIRSQCWT